MTDVTIIDAIYTLLSGDATLQGYLGGSGRVRIGWVNQDSTFPCVTIYDGSESSDPRVGYATSGQRDNSPSVQIDTWVDASSEPPLPSTSRDLNVIANYVDALLMKTGIAGTWGWSRNAYPEQQERSVQTTLYHKTMAYQFRYLKTD